MTLAGEMLLTTGDGLFTVNLAPLETPPPGVGFDTVMVAIAPLVKSLAGSAAANCVVLENVVWRATPLNSATKAATNLMRDLRSGCSLSKGNLETITGD